MVFLLLLSMMWISDGCDDCVGLGWFAIINGYWLILVFRLLRCLSCEFHLHLVDLLLARGPLELERWLQVSGPLGVCNC